MEDHPIDNEAYNDNDNIDCNLDDNLFMSEMEPDIGLDTNIGVSEMDIDSTDVLDAELEQNSPAAASRKSNIPKKSVGGTITVYTTDCNCVFVMHLWCFLYLTNYFVSNPSNLYIRCIKRYMIENVVFYIYILVNSNLSVSSFVSLSLVLYKYTIKYVLSGKYYFFFVYDGR